MNGYSPYNKYAEQSVKTASPCELIIMLYDGAIKNIKKGKAAIEAKKPSEANVALQKAQDIIEALVSALNLNYKIADDLLAIYQVCQTALIEANISKDVAKIDKLIEILTELRDAWTQVLKSGRQATFG